MESGARRSWRRAAVARRSRDRARPGESASLSATHAATAAGGGGGAKITRVKLLKPKDTLLLGQVYRLITSQG